MLKQGDLYFQRMSAGLQDKTMMLDFIKPNNVLDIGAGSGEFVELLNESGFNGVGLDASDEAISRMNDIGVANVKGFTHEVKDLFPKKSFNTITASSIFHEIYSYGKDGFPESKFTKKIIKDNLAGFHHILCRKGILIIRDGVIPEFPFIKQTVVFKNPDDIRLARLYVDMIPKQMERLCNLEFVSDDTIRGTRQAIMEFLYTYTWGEKAFERETQEQYGIFTNNEYRDFLSKNNFKPIYTKMYTQQGYIDNLKDKVTIFEDGVPVAFPYSQQLIVAQKC